ncbi:MAG: 6,7-dimethyl-8-ribityllumazine synthase [Acidobacteriota bacterium]
MSEIHHVEGRLDATGRRFGVVASRFNSRITDLLLAGAVDCLRRHGVVEADLHVARVPGAWEIPLALDAMAQSGNVDGLVAIGVVIRGETPHFEYVCDACCKGAAAVGAKTGIPVGFGVLTTDDSPQAVERAGGKAGNKGWEAALAVIEMVDLVEQLRGSAS